jgi:hypothetical protein
MLAPLCFRFPRLPALVLLARFAARLPLDS